MRKLKRVDPERHPLTEQYISLVGGGMAPLDAAMALVGPKLRVEDVHTEIFNWEMDPEVTLRIAALAKGQDDSKRAVYAESVARLVSIIGADPRLFWDENGVKPPERWSKSMAMSVKRIKVTEKTDPFGSTTRNTTLEFYDPIPAIKALKEVAPEVIAEVEDYRAGAIDITALQSMSDEELNEIQQKLLKVV